MSPEPQKAKPPVFGFLGEFDTVEDLVAAVVAIAASGNKDPPLPRLALPSQHIRVFAQRPALGVVGLDQVNDRLEFSVFVRPFRAAGDRVSAAPSTRRATKWR